ncbi:MAG: sigma 54-interacting transcriptional regulator [Nitrospirae bacterium]|nr:sigma 54-interacting transcriptional regulator [Nitrospirota bacterium]
MEPESKGPVEAKNLAELEDKNVCTKPVSSRFAAEAIYMLREGMQMFPSIYGLDHVKRRLVEVLMTGHGVILKGDFGVGKTALANAIFAVVKRYYDTHPVYSNVGCPVRENSKYLYDYLVMGEHSALPGVCPVCRHAYLQTETRPSDIPVERVYLAEGAGFARVQGNEDVDPEKILGMYHLGRYAEIGDPFDPRVLVPGKIAQASGGVFFVDELGLLNKEAQYALIQGLQEKHFSPTNSRMTFPIDFLFVSTTNTVNEFQIHKAIHNRLVGLRIDRVTAFEEAAIVRENLAERQFGVYFPELFIEYLVEAIRQLSDVSVYLGPRSTIRASQIAAASALLEGRHAVSYCDVREAIYTEVLGQADDETYDECRKTLSMGILKISDFLRDRLPSVEALALALETEGETPETVDESLLVGMPEAAGQRRDVVGLYVDAYLKECG